MSARTKLVVEHANLDDLHPHPMNPRHGNVAMLAASLEKLDQYKASVVVNRGTHTGRPNEILTGHHLVKAAQSLGWEGLDVTYVDVDDEKATRILLADNRTSDVSTYDDRLLLEALASLPDLDGVGYDPGDLEALEALLEGGDGDHSGDDQDILDRTDQATWPEVRFRLHPDTMKRWREVPGEEDVEKALCLLNAFGA